MKIKVFIPKIARENRIGGGWTFTYNLIRSLGDKIEFIDDFRKCDIYFIPGSTLALKDEVKEVKRLNKKIVLRIDNIPRNSRNRNTGTSRLYSYAQMADTVVYQSEWAKDFIMPFIKKDGVVIMNGVDTSVFNPDGDKIKKDGSPQFLYVRYNRDETKRWELAWYWFQKEYFRNPDAHLWIVGRFSPEQEEYNFDLFGGAEERYKFFGVIEDRKELAKIYRSADVLLCPYYNEACSNVVAEAMACGLSIRYADNSGGVEEQVRNGVMSIKKMGEEYLKVFENVLK